MAQPQGGINPYAVPYHVDLITIFWNGSPEPVATLDSYMSQWAASVAAFPSSLAGTDPLTQALAIAQGRCTTITTPDCAQAATIAATYAAVVVEALKHVGEPIQGPVYGYPPSGDFGALPGTGPGFTPVAPPAPTATPPPVAPVIVPVKVPSTAPAAAPVINGKPPDPGQLVKLGFPGLRPEVLPIAGAAGGPITFGIAIVVEIIGALFGGLFGGPDIGKLVDAINQTRQALADITDQLYRFAWTVAYGLGKLLVLVHDVWISFFDALWQLIKNSVTQLWKLLGTWLPKIIETIQRIRKLLDQIYTKYIRPALAYLQLLRKWLALAKLLHIPFAAKLDSILVRIQSKILAPFLYVLRTLNGIGNWVNLIITTRATIQRAVFLRTMFENQGAIVNGWWNSQSPKAATAADTLTPGAPAPMGQPAAIANLDAYGQGAAVPFGVTIDQGVTELQIAAQTS